MVSPLTRISPTCSPLSCLRYLTLILTNLLGIVSLLISLIPFQALTCKPLKFLLQLYLTNIRMENQMVQVIFLMLLYLPRRYSQQPFESTFHCCCKTRLCSQPLKRLYSSANSQTRERPDLLRQLQTNCSCSNIE